METEIKNTAGVKKTDITPVPEKKIPEKPMEVRYPDNGKRRFNMGRLFLGIIILLIGLFYLGRNIGIIPAGYGINIWQLWPLIIIYFGLSMLSSRGWFSTLLGVIATIFVLIIVVIALFVGNIINLGVSSTIQTIPINIIRDSNADSAVINIKTGAGNISMAGGARELVEGNLKTNFMEIKQGYTVRDGVETVDLESTGGSWNWPNSGGQYANNLELEVNSDTPLKINLDSGASNINIDFSNIALESADITSGVSGLNLTLGEKLNESSVKIDAGVSSVKIHVPKSLGVKLLIEGGFNSNKLDKFIEVDNKNFLSENYSTSNKKVYIEANLGISSIEIDWL